MKKEFFFWFIYFSLIILLIISLVRYSLKEDYEPAFDLCVENYKGILFYNLVLTQQIDNQTINETNIALIINNSNIKQQFLDEIENEK